MYQRNDSDNNRPLIFIILFLIALAVFSNLSGWLVMFFIAAALFWALRNVDFNNFGNSDFFQRNSRNNQDLNDYYEDEYEEDVEEPIINREPIYRHALTAVQNAGLDPDAVQVLAVDLGVMSYKPGEQPSVFRTWTVPDDADALQPFVQLRLPSDANGVVRFEILDSSGKVVFMHEADQALKKGRNFISPPARMPMNNLNMDGRWQLRISADGVLLAVHSFEFTEATTANIRRHIAEDGEIATDSRLLMDETPMPKMSLDDLLSYQDKDSKQQRK
jgi:hypothetical protein